jgi:hypothetical protein
LHSGGALARSAPAVRRLLRPGVEELAPLKAGEVLVRVEAAGLNETCATRAQAES